MSRRSKSPYPALDPRLNLKSRAEIIETDYINGLYDKDGNQVIRALTEDEKAWLNKFYTETVNASFVKDGTDFYTSSEDRKKLYTENNKRNSCVFTKSKKLNKLDTIDNTTYEIMNEEVCESYDPEDILLSKERSIKQLEEISKNLKNRRTKLNRSSTKNHSKP